MSDMVHRWHQLVKRLNVNRVSRLNQHYRAIKNDIAPKGVKEREEAAFFKKTFEKYQRDAHRLITIRVFFYAFLYASIVVNMLQVISWLHFLVAFIELGSSLFGAGIALLVVLYLTVKINLYTQLMNQCLAHLAVFYQANPKRDTTSTLKALQKTL